MTASKSGSDPKRALRRVRVAGLAAALVGALLLALAGEGLSRPLFDLWQRMSPRDLADTQVRVVAIDEESLRAVGAWPWPRYQMARLTEQIAARGPAAIGFDIIFDQPDPIRPEAFADQYPELDPASRAALVALPSGDEVLAEAIGRSPAVLARAGAEVGGTGASELVSEARIEGAAPPALPRYLRAVASLPDLEFAARGHGLIGVDPDPDGVVRSVSLLAKLGDTPAPGLSLELVRVARKREVIATGPVTVRLGGLAIPVSERGDLRLRFGTFPRQATIPAVDLFRRGFPADALAGKIVLVGLAAEGTEDVVATPLEREGFGIYVHAQAIDALLRGSGWLDRPGWARHAEWLAGLLFVLLVVYVLPRRGALQFVVPVLPFLLLGLSFAAFRQAALLLDPLVPLLLGGAASAGVGIASLGEARRERERLRDALVQERILAERLEEEMHQARGIQLGMLPPPGSLTALDPRLEIGAVLEPARSVGGDFYDALRLDADRIAFCIADVTGKGVPAALFMALSKALARSIILREPRLDAATALLNQELSRDGIDSGLTLLMGIIDLGSGQVALVSAGHDDPFRIAADGTVCDVRLEGGPPLCILDYPWPIDRIQLAPGEALILITDGVSEAQTATHEFFGRERALEALSVAARSSVDEIAAELVQSVRSFEAGAEPSDDLTVLALRWRG